MGDPRILQLSFWRCALEREGRGKFTCVPKRCCGLASKYEKLEAASLPVNRAVHKHNVPDSRIANCRLKK